MPRKEACTLVSEMHPIPVTCYNNVTVRDVRIVGNVSNLQEELIIEELTASSLKVTSFLLKEILKKMLI